MNKINWNNYTISKLCLGTVQFGLDYGVANKSGKQSQENVNEILKYVELKGINCLDTGSMYGNSEEKIGKFIRDKNSNSLKIISKIKSDFFDLEHEDSLESIQKSLNYLSVNSLFALLLHNIEALETWDEKKTVLIKNLKKENKIKYFGISIYTNKEFDLALENVNIDIIQIPFNLLDQRAITNKWLLKAKEKNKLIFIRSVYLQGLLLMDVENIPLHLYNAKKYLNIINEVANKLNITKNELALSFVDQMAKESILLFGCDNLEQAIENIENYNNLVKIDEDTVKYLRNTFSNIDEYIYNPSKWNQK